MIRHSGQWLLVALCCLASMSGSAQGRDTRLVQAAKRGDAAAVRARHAQRADMRGTHADG